MSKNKHMPEHKRLVTACALPKIKSRMDKSLVKIQCVESGVCGCASEFDIAGIRVSVYTRWLKRASDLPPPSVDTQAESKAEVSGSREETRKGCKEE